MTIGYAKVLAALALAWGAHHPAHHHHHRHAHHARPVTTTVAHPAPAVATAPPPARTPAPAAPSSEDTAPVEEWSSLECETSDQCEKLFRRIEEETAGEPPDQCEYIEGTPSEAACEARWEDERDEHEEEEASR